MHSGSLFCLGPQAMCSTPPVNRKRLADAVNTSRPNGAGIPDMMSMDGSANGIFTRGFESIHRRRRAVLLLEMALTFAEWAGLLARALGALGLDAAGKVRHGSDVLRLG
jgi:hypothetical protein